MNKTYTFRAHCGRDIRLEPTGSGDYVLIDTCDQCEVARGSGLASLVQACEGCQPASQVQVTNATKELTMSGSNGNSHGTNAGPTLPGMEGQSTPPPPGLGGSGSVPQVEEVSQQEQPAEDKSPPAPQTMQAIQVTGGSDVQPAQGPITQVIPGGQAEAPAFGTPGAASEGNLLGQLLVGVGGEELVDVNAAIDTVPGLEGGPSKGGISWHTLEPAMQCWRKAYLTHVLGLEPKQMGRALSFGSLFHACWELWYRFGGTRRYDEPCDAVRQAGAPKLAGEVQRLVYAELQRFAAEEAQTWDIRAVEQNAIFWMEPERINGKSVQIPITCRHDLILAKREPGAACAPPGPAPQGVYIYDHKTASALTYDMTKGYGQDPQFLTNTLVYVRSNEPDMFGPLNGVIVGVAAKHKEPSDRSFFRIETTVDLGAIEEFYREEVRPYAIEFYRRITDKDIRGDRNRWPKNRSQCVGRYGCCKFFDVCDVGGDSLIDAMFKVNESRILDPERFAQPPAEVKKQQVEADPKKAAQAEAREAKTELRNKHRDLLRDSFAAYLQTQEAFDSKKFLTHEHTEKSVLTNLTEALKVAWDAGTEFPFGPDAEGNIYTVTINEKSIAWVLQQPESKELETEQETGKKKRKKKTPPLKGTLTYKMTAEAICKDWWDLNRLNPRQGT